jgi:tRNA threonylcarbamoyladenosine modification (KEOPS) complex  Pcc1 subunit
MSTKAKANVRLKFATQKQIATILSALSPEAATPQTRRANIKLEGDGLFFMLTVEAEDTVALRATLNAYLRWINSTVNVMSLVEDT